MESLAEYATGVPPIVLVVEDDPTTLELYDTALTLAGLWVAKAVEPGDALEYAMDLRPDAVVMDIAIPTLHDGINLARGFRESVKTADTPLVAVTDADPAKIRDTAGVFTSVFYKPVPLNQMVRRVRWLSLKSAVLRELGERARARIPELVARSTELLGRSHALSRRCADITRVDPDLLTSTVRLCPKCRRTLTFSERRAHEGTTFDYYSPCRNGCGLFCFDHSRRTMITLVG
jgi:DNA-binding response OmpR family regulator